MSRTFWNRAPCLYIHIILIFVTLTFQLCLAKKDKCGVQVVAIEQIKYKPIPVEVVEKSSMKSVMYEPESAPPPASYSQPTTAAPSYATTTPPMPKPTTTTNKKMDITELIKEMYGPPPAPKSTPKSTPPPAPQIYVMPAPSQKPQPPQMVYMVTSPAPAPPTRPPQSYQMMPMMMPQIPYTMNTPPPQPPMMTGYNLNPSMQMMLNYGDQSPPQMMGYTVEHQPPANAMVNNYGNSVTPNNYNVPVTMVTATTPSIPTSNNQAASTPAPTKGNQYSSSQQFVTFPQSQQKFGSFPQISFEEGEAEYAGQQLQGPIAGMNVNNQMKPYQEMSSQVGKRQYPSRMKDHYDEYGEDEEDDDYERATFTRQKQKPVDVVLGYRVGRPISAQSDTSFPSPDPTFRDMLMSKLTSGTFGRRSSSFNGKSRVETIESEKSENEKSEKEEMKSNNQAEDRNNMKVLNELRLRSQIEQTLDRILFNGNRK